MECAVDLAPLLFVELHVDVLQVQVHLVLEVSEAEEDLAMRLPLRIGFMRQNRIIVLNKKLQAHLLGGLS